MGHLSVPSQSNLCLSHGISIEMTFPWTSLGLSMGHIYLSHSRPIAIYAYPIPLDVSHRNDIPIDKPENVTVRYHVFYNLWFVP